MNNPRPYPGPWDRDSYETGSTRPPKSYGGIIAVLLVAVIVLCGITSMLSAANIRLSQGNQSVSDTPALNFQPGTASEPSTSASPTVPTGAGEDFRMELETAPDSYENFPQSDGKSLQQIYEENIPSVVSITCTAQSGNSSGTGVVVSRDGYLVTNCHVVEGAASISVLLSDGRTFPAALVGTDVISDLAVLYIDAHDLTAATFGDCTTLRVGDAVAAIGDPLGLELRGTMTDGIISAINRNITVDGRTMTLIQTNAALNSGNSGGPLINCYGQVIGINTMKISAFVDDAGVEGLGFAIPSTTVKEVVDQLIRQGYVSGRPSLGVSVEDISDAARRYWRLPAGVLVSDVQSGSCAEKAGLREGDIIMSINDVRISSVDAFSTALYRLHAGEEITLQCYRYRAEEQFSVTLKLDEAKK